MATTGTTRPSSARWRRSRSTSSPTSPVRVPSMRMRPDRRLARDARAGRVEVQDVAVLGEEDLGPGRARQKRAGDARAGAKLAVLAVNRDEDSVARTRNISFSSSSLPCPDTWTCLMPS